MSAFPEILKSYADAPLKKLYSAPCFLQKVYHEEFRSNGNTEGHHELLIIAVHAVLLESGFVSFDTKAQLRIGGFHLPAGWASNPSVHVQYTVPDLFLHDKAEVIMDTVDVVFNTIGEYMYVHGSLDGRNHVWLLSLDTSQFIPYTDNQIREGEVYKLWKIVKDGLASPLLSALCGKTGLVPPPCFMCLPNDLKLKILMLLPGIDIAKVGCVSKELMYLSSRDDLWELKCEEESSITDASTWGLREKEKYVLAWQIAREKEKNPFELYSRKRMKKMDSRVETISNGLSFFHI